MDRSILYDILSTLISQPEVWTLDIAVEAVHGANELSRVGTDNQIKMASEVTKFVLTRFRDTFQDAFAPVVSKIQKCSKNSRKDFLGFDILLRSAELQTEPQRSNISKSTPKMPFWTNFKRNSASR